MHLNQQFWQYRILPSQYQEENPDLDFNFEIENISDRTAYLQKLKILAASDELPEWFDSDPDTWFADIVADGKAYSFEDLYKELGMYDQIFPISKEYSKTFRWQSESDDAAVQHRIFLLQQRSV